MKLLTICTVVAVGQNARQPRDTLADTAERVLTNLAEAIGFNDNAPPPPPDYKVQVAVVDSQTPQNNTQTAQESNQSVKQSNQETQTTNQDDHAGWLTAEEQAGLQPNNDAIVDEIEVVASE